jgi:hypothetical protein
LHLRNVAFASHHRRAGAGDQESSIVSSAGGGLPFGSVGQLAVCKELDVEIVYKGQKKKWQF